MHRIIHEDLSWHKVCAKFIPRVLNEEQRDRRIGDRREMVELITLNPIVLDIQELDILLRSRV